MDWTPAAQPSTGEISAAQPSGEISSDDEDFAGDEDFLDLVALRNLVGREPFELYQKEPSRWIVAGVWFDAAFCSLSSRHFRSVEQ